MSLTQHIRRKLNFAKNFKTCFWYRILLYYCKRILIKKTKKIMATHLKVFITKKQKIRVRITKIYESFEPEANSVEEVTVGSEKWKSGDYNKYEANLRVKVKKIITNIERQFYKYI